MQAPAVLFTHLRETMRILTACLGLCLAALLTAAPTLAQHEKTLDFTETLDADGRLAVASHKGSITVTTWDRAEVAVAVRIVAGNDDYRDRDEDYYRKIVEETEVDVRRAGGTLYVETNYDQIHCRRRKVLGLISTESCDTPYVHYEIRMPRTAGLVVEDHKSDVRVTDLRADLHIDTHKGEVVVEDLDGALHLTTHKSRVRVDFRRLAGDTTIDTYKGDVTLTLPRDAAFDFVADLSRKGNLDSDFSIDRIRHRDDEDDDDKRYRTSVNGGGPQLRLESYKGDFVLRAR